MLNIPGYEGGPLTRADAYLDHPLFWPLHLGSSLPGEDAQRAAFGADWDAADDLYRALAAEDEWPVFSVPLRSGHTVHVVYRNIEGEGGVDYLIHHPAWPDAETLAVDDGHFMGPGMAWPELLHAAEPPAEPAAETTDARLLLLFPTLGDACLPDDATTAVTTALAALTVIEDPATVARTLLENQGQWTPAHWSSVNGVRINDGGHSYRNPANPFALPGQRLKEISDALSNPNPNPNP
ncbi:hypothetical protein [Streptomyces liangshanensis]|uniref:Uncharacterized protein n=1 Tax=Streptomyces liangshanensis TaxID=2717324 RepID=A0A6G9GZB9_9ACTN|nr:hypothetical protein [Streptomyces liangshanensis]QIQ03632.1 hypothetical protein HA039_16000 [Streptomyces liangshanensis]